LSKLEEAEEEVAGRLMFESLPNFLVDFSTLDMKFSLSAVESLFFEELRLSEELLSLEEFKLLSERLREDERDWENIDEVLRLASKSCCDT
jgi:hypothetical protein